MNENKKRKIKIAAGKEEVASFTGISLVVDLFRFSCTVACLLESGRRELEIFSNPDLAVAHYRNLKEAEIFSEIDLGVPEKIDNSPYRVMNSRDQGKRAVVVTNSGAKAVMGSGRAAEILIAGFHNLPAAVAYLAGKKDDVLLVPACVFYDRKHIEDIIACEAFSAALDGSGKPEDFVFRIHDTPRVLELMQFRPETAALDLEFIMKLGNIKSLPRAVIRGVYASVENAV